MVTHTSLVTSLGSVVEGIVVRIAADSNRLDTIIAQARDSQAAVHTTNDAFDNRIKHMEEQVNNAGSRYERLEERLEELIRGSPLHSQPRLHQLEKDVVSKKLKLHTIHKTPREMRDSNSDSSHKATSPQTHRSYVGTDIPFSIYSTRTSRSGVSVPVPTTLEEIQAELINQLGPILQYALEHDTNPAYKVAHYTFLREYLRLAPLGSRYPPEPIWKYQNGLLETTVTVLRSDLCDAGEGLFFTRNVASTRDNSLTLFYEGLLTDQRRPTAMYIRGTDKGYDLYVDAAIESGIAVKINAFYWRTAKEESTTSKACFRMLSGGLAALRLEKKGVRGKEALLDTYGSEFDWWNIKLLRTLDVVQIILSYQEQYEDEGNNIDKYEQLRIVIRIGIREHVPRDHIEHQLKYGANDPVLWEYNKILSMIQEQDILETQDDTSVAGLLLGSKAFCNAYRFLEAKNPYLIEPDKEVFHKYLKQLGKKKLVQVLINSKN